MPRHRRRLPRRWRWIAHEAVAVARAQPHSRFPVIDGGTTTSSASCTCATCCSARDDTPACGELVRDIMRLPVDQARPAGAVRDAPRAPPPGHRGRRVRRHGRHRHPGGPRRGAGRRDPRRVRRRAGAVGRRRPAAPPRSTAGSTWTTSPTRPGSRCPTGPTRPSAGFVMAPWAGCPGSGTTRSMSAGVQLTVLDAGRAPCRHGPREPARSAGAAEPRWPTSAGRGGGARSPVAECAVDPEH